MTSFQQAVDNQIIEESRMSGRMKIGILDDLFDFARSVAICRAAEGDSTYGAHGTLWWSADLALQAQPEPDCQPRRDPNAS